MSELSQILQRLAELIQQDSYESLESDTVEIKPVPAETGSWRERYKSVNAFLNTRGGFLILGVKEADGPQGKRYVHTGWQENAEEKLKHFRNEMTDKQGGRLAQIEERLPSLQIHPFLRNGQVAVLLVDELPADQKFAFYRSQAWKRVGTGDHRISDAEIEAQEEYKGELVQARELRPIVDVTLEAIDLDKLNEYISQLNKPTKIETIKASLEDAKSFLERKSFLRDGTVTTLGMLVCGKHPADHLGFRCHVHGYVDVPNEVARDKHDIVDNILPLMERTYSYVLRNIHVGVSHEKGGSARLEYPDELLRETINNALAHRDYSIDKQVIVAIAPAQHIAITNPGTFRSHLLIERPSDSVPIRRIIPEAKARNPKLADVLRVYRKWEGRGIGMATLVDMALQNRIDLPYYRLKSEEVTLHLCHGRLVDKRMERLYQSFAGYIKHRLDGRELSEPQQSVLAYLIKSERANEQLWYTILLTRDNNHFDELRTLERSGLIEQHPASRAEYPIYIADRTLVTQSYMKELREIFGPGVDDLKPLHQDILNRTYRYSKYSGNEAVSAKQLSYSLWYEGDEPQKDDLEKFDQFYRRVRNAVNTLEGDKYLQKVDKKIGGAQPYTLNEHRREEFLPV